MIKFFLATVLLFVASLNVLAQKNYDNTLPPNLSLRFNVLGLADPLDQNLSFGIEHRFRSKWSVGTDAGWIFESRFFQQQKGSDGLIVRPFLRHYPKNGNGFIEFQMHFKYVSYKIEDWLGREPVNNVPTYEEFTTFNLERYAAGIHFIAGLQGNISRNERVKIEFTAGAGLRAKWQKVRNGIYTRDGSPFVSNNDPSDVSVTPVLPVNLRLVYVLK